MLAVIIGTMVGIVVVGFTLMGILDVVSVIVTGREYNTKTPNVPVPTIRRVMVTIWTAVCLMVTAAGYLSGGEISDSPLLVICFAIPALCVFVIALPYSFGHFHNTFVEGGS